ncbi:MAG: fatty acid desaturase [Spirochaetota bacterium]
MVRSDFRGAVQTLGYLGLLSVLGALVWAFWDARVWVAFGPALFVYGTVCSFNGGILVGHELSHGTVFKTKWMNTFFLRFFCLIGWVNPHHYKRSHTFHHIFTLHPRGDREVVLPRTPSLHPIRILLLLTFNLYGFLLVVWSTVTLAFAGRFAFDGKFGRQWSEDLYPEEAAAERSKARKWAWVLLIFHALVVASGVVFHLWMLPVLITAGGYIGNFWMYFVGEPMHNGLRDNVSDFRLCCRSIKLDQVSGFLYWHMNHHTEHHMYAAVPCYNLRKLATALVSDMPQPRTLLGAWREMRQTWKRQRIDPSYRFDTPLPSPPSKAADSDALAASLGDLASGEFKEEGKA